MTGNVDFDAKRMFKHACAFAGCAKFCEREPWNLERRLPDYTIADIVNSAFACEVFIKALLLHNSISIEEMQKSGHKMKDLWMKLESTNSNLTDDAKKRILSAFQTDNPEFFNEGLDSISNAFATWRYIYEKHGSQIHLQFLRYFRIVLQEICCETFYNMSWNDFAKEV